ncbi:odorant receptor 4-like [Xylocopa sonorina]|uniref:odorant receptor 4-like n=1 Tax=Xylocopa sonorina TaxID=1818115 RepID=UPI00403AC29F
MCSTGFLLNNLYTMTTISIANHILKFGLHAAVTWPETPLPYFRRFCWLMTLGVLQTYQYRYVIINFKSNTITEIIDNLSICMPFTLVFCKLCIAWLYSSLVSDIFSTMEKDYQKSAGTEATNFVLKALHFSYRFTSVVIYMFVASAAFYMFGSIMSQSANTITTRKFLLKMALPFDTSESPIYELVIGIQFVYQGMTAYIFGVFTALLLMVVLHLGCQIDLMCQKLTDIPYKSRRHLRLFIIRHQEIIIFANKMEKLFTYMALCQLLSNTLLICCLGYIIVLAIQMNNGFVLLIKCLVFYISICMEVFVYCFAGEYLSIKSKLICDTAYKLLWYDIDPSDSQLLILVILRAQKGFTFTFGKFANLSMESFAAIMKASASYMSVLLAMT